MANISTWSTSAASNNAATPDGWPEGQSPSSVNNCGREMMAAIRTWFEDAQWINLGHTPTKVDGDTFTLSGDQTAIYEAGRRVKMTGSATAYGTILSSSYSAPNTTVNLTTSAIPNTLSTVAVSVLTASNSSLPDVGTSFTATLTGVSGTVTDTAYYYKLGKTVILTLPTLTGTSNATSKTITGLPSAIAPARTVSQIGAGLNNGGSSFEAVSMSIVAAATTITVGRLVNDGLWTASGLASVIGITMVYEGS